MISRVILMDHTLYESQQKPLEEVRVDITEVRDPGTNLGNHGQWCVELSTVHARKHCSVQVEPMISGTKKARYLFRGGRCTSFNCRGFLGLIILGFAPERNKIKCFKSQYIILPQHILVMPLFALFVKVYLSVDLFVYLGNCIILKGWELVSLQQMDLKSLFCILIIFLAGLICQGPVGLLDQRHFLWSHWIQ